MDRPGGGLPPLSQRAPKEYSKDNEKVLVPTPSNARRYGPIPVNDAGSTRVSNAGNKEPLLGGAFARVMSHGISVRMDTPTKLRVIMILRLAATAVVITLHMLDCPCSPEYLSEPPEGCHHAVMSVILAVRTVYMAAPLPSILASFVSMDFARAIVAPSVCAGQLFLSLAFILRPFLGVPAVLDILDHCGYLIASVILSMITTSVTMDAGIVVPPWLEHGTVATSTLLITFSAWAAVVKAPDMFYGQAVKVPSIAYIAAGLIPLIVPATYYGMSWLIHGGSISSISRRSSTRGDEKNRKSVRWAAHITIVAWTLGLCLSCLCGGLILAVLAHDKAPSRGAYLGALLLGFAGGFGIVIVSRVAVTMMNFTRNQVLSSVLPSQAVNRVMELAATSALGTDGGVRGSRVGTVAPSESRDGLAPSRGQSKQMGGDLIYREVKDRTAVVALDVPKLHNALWSLAHEEAANLVHALHSAFETLASTAGAFRVEQESVVPCVFLLAPEKGAQTPVAMALDLARSACRAAISVIDSGISTRRRSRLLGGLRAVAAVHVGQVCLFVTGHRSPTARALGPAIKHALRLTSILGTSPSLGSLAMSAEVGEIAGTAGDGFQKVKLRGGKKCHPFDVLVEGGAETDETTGEGEREEGRREGEEEEDEEGDGMSGYSVSGAEDTGAEGPAHAGAKEGNAAGVGSSEGKPRQRAASSGKRGTATAPVSTLGT